MLCSRRISSTSTATSLPHSPPTHPSHTSLPHSAPTLPSYTPLPHFPPTLPSHTPCSIGSACGATSNSLASPALKVVVSRWPQSDHHLPTTSPSHNPSAHPQRPPQPKALPPLIPTSLTPHFKNPSTASNVACGPACCQTRTVPSLSMTTTPRVVEPGFFIPMAWVRLALGSHYWFRKRQWP
jgi:hypothetical protein